MPIILFAMYFEINGARIRYNDSGKGTVVVLLHGYLETSEVWRSFAEKLSEKYRVITVDLPGHGMSDSLGSINSMESMASALKDLLGSLNISKVFLTGHSLGGYVTLAFLENFTDSLSGYCLFHSQPFSDPAEVVEKRKREITMVLEGKKELLCRDNITRMYANENLERFAGFLSHSIEIASGLSDEGIIALLKGMMTRPSRLKVMEEGRVPCLWILGKKDNYINCDIILSRVRLPQNAQVDILTNSGHLGFIEQADDSYKTMTEFIDRL